MTVDIINAIIIIIILSLLLSINPVFADTDNPKALFDESGPMGPDYGKSVTIFNIGTFGGSGFASLLESYGYTVSKNTEKPITPEKLEGYDVLIIMNAYRNYTDEEVNTIKKFVNNGGGLFLVGNNWGDIDGGKDFSFNKIAQSFGVSFANNQLVVDDNNYLFFTSNVMVNDITPSPITNNITSFYYYMGSYIEDPGPSNVVASTTPESWGDRGQTAPDGSVTSNLEKDTNEASGPFAVVSELEYGNGRVIFMGAALTYSNSMMYRNNGWKLGLNSVNWLSGRSVPSSYTVADTVSLNLGDMWYRVLGLILLAAILISVFYYILRRGRESEKTHSQIKTIKSWKFKILTLVNVVFLILVCLIFFPINILLFDISQNLFYDPNLGYAMIIIGVLYLSLAAVILYNIVARQLLPVKFNYYILIIIIFWLGFLILLGDLFGFIAIPLLLIGISISLVPMVVNILYHRIYGPYLIIEGKEFDRLEKLSANALLYEFRTIYTDLDYLGEGGFGRVFKATNKKGRKVAIKIPKTFDRRAERTFVTEVSNWSHLDHPNIVQLYDFKILPIPYIETEFCEDQLKKEKKPLKEAVNIIHEVAQGLQYAHKKHIIHGDVKFSNILIKDGVYKISDWGLSKLKTDESLSLSGATPSYAAPEQISHDFGKADERTDIYQLGIVFYALITGRLPFKGEIFQIYSSTLNKKPTPPQEINTDAGPVSDIIMKCLNKNKEDRFSSMGELIEALNEFIANETRLFDDDSQV